MTETNYNIKPLPTLPSIHRLNDTKDGEDRRKQKNFEQRREANIDACQNEDAAEHEKQIINDNNENVDGIDYCA